MFLMLDVKFKLTYLGVPNFPKYYLFEAIKIEWNNSDYFFLMKKLLAKFTHKT